MKVTQEDFNMLKKISKEIDEFFKVTFSIKEARSTDIYDFLKNRNLLNNSFSNSIEFNRFLRRMQKADLIRQIIPNYTVDTSNPNFFQWRFYRKEIKRNLNNINSDYRISSSSFFKGNKIVPTNSGEFVRSVQEQYIYNKLLNEEYLLIYYERALEKKFPDFTIANKLTGIVYHWEHFGMTNNPEYSDKIANRIKWYLNKGYNYIEKGGRLIITYYKDEENFKQEVERVLKLIKGQIRK